MNKKQINKLLLAGAMGVILAACNPNVVETEKTADGEMTQKPQEAGRPIGEFPEVDIETVEMSPVFEHLPNDMPTYALELNDGHFTPRVLVVPKDTKFRLRITNTGTKPCEFESLQLRKEKPLFMGATSTLVIIPLQKGKYDMFDDFTNGHPGYIVAK